MGKTLYIREIDKLISSDSLSTPQIFTLNDGAGKNIMVEYFYFVDSGGGQVDPTGGTVDITMSAGGDIYNTIDGGSFAAADARAASRKKPNAYGSAEKVKFTFTSLTGSATGFRCLITQSC